jgi:hypothetical protein
MKKIPTAEDSRTDEMRPEYDFSSGVRGKYAERYPRGTDHELPDPGAADRGGSGSEESGDAP